ncbi:hypothetical protein HWV62_25898 [Athelia sp. TMB]|nr:hypothetical protein HWV62_25898 [Athelia sp. TMB]
MHVSLLGNCAAHEAYSFTESVARKSAWLSELPRVTYVLFGASAELLARLRAARNPALICTIVKRINSRNAVFTVIQMLTLRFADAAAGRLLAAREIGSEVGSACLGAERKGLRPVEVLRSYVTMLQRSANKLIRYKWNEIRSPHHSFLERLLQEGQRGLGLAYEMRNQSRVCSPWQHIS